MTPLRADGTSATVGYLSAYEHRARVSLTTLTPGKYSIMVIAPGGAVSPDASAVGFTLQANVVGTDTSTTGTFGVTPTRPATRPGVPYTVTGTWSGVDTSAPATAYVRYQDGTGTLVGISG